MSEQVPRFSLYRLCECPDPNCDRGKIDGERCPVCRGEAKIRDELAACSTEEAVGVALITLAREGEWIDTNGDPCAFGLLDRKGEVGKKWLILPWKPSPRNVSDAGRVLASGRKATP